MKKVLFIDRDGTLIVEPESDKQVDSLEKLEFLPSVFAALTAIQRTLSYEFVMVTNQDGLGTESFPEETFWPAHNKMLKMLEGEGIYFSEILIDRSLPEDNAPTRKPGTGMLESYLSGEYDLENSFVIGDRQSDVELAQNLGSKSILFAEERGEEATFTTSSWSDVYTFLRREERCSKVVRNTSETKINLSLSLDGSGESQIETGLGFFDHMLEQIAKHAGCNLQIAVDGDLQVDEHHTIEDTAIAFGEAVAACLQDKRGIARYGFLLPMDDCRAQVALDFCSRPAFVWEAKFSREKVGDMPTEMFSHFFKSFSDAARCNLQITAQGENEHHKIESIFKAFARSLKQAWYLDYAEQVLPSTKGCL